MLQKGKTTDLWTNHTAWDRERDWHNRKQWVLVPVPVSDQCDPFDMSLPSDPVPGPVPM